MHMSVKKSTEKNKKADSYFSNKSYTNHINVGSAKNITIFPLFKMQ
jgi:hypothetical protein